MIQFKRMALCKEHAPALLVTLPGQKPSPRRSPHSFLYGKCGAKGVKDGNYLIGLLTNSALSAAVWRGSWAGEGPCSLPSFTKSAGAGEERGFFKGSGVGWGGEERWEVWLRIFPHNSQNGGGGGRGRGGGWGRGCRRAGGREGGRGGASVCGGLGGAPARCQARSARAAVPPPRQHPLDPEERRRAGGAAEPAPPLSPLPLSPPPPSPDHPRAHALSGSGGLLWRWRQTLGFYFI